MLNRGTLLVDPNGSSQVLTLDDVGQERTVHLVEAEDEEELEDWLARAHVAVFEQEL